MKSKTARLTAAAVIVIVAAVAIKQVVLQKQQAQSTKRITQYSKNKTVKDSKTPKIGESVEKSSANADMQTKKVKRVRHSRALSVSSARRPAPDKAKIEAEAKQIQEMVATGDIDGLTEMLSIGEFPGKVAAAEHLGEIGNERALPELERLNNENGGWWIEGGHVFREDHDSSGAFAVAICKILTKDLPQKERIERLFDLLEGRGPAVPEGVKENTAKYNFDIGRRAVAELDKIGDASIVERLRQSENKGAAIGAVWMAVRDMGIESAIERCMEIARDEGGAQGYGAIKCLGKFGYDAIDALDELTNEGHDEAIRTLGYNKKNPEVLKLICWHLTNNRNSRVRLMAINQFYGDVLQYQQPELLQAFIKTLYDPNKYIRRNAAQLLSYAAFRKNKPQFEKFEDDMLIALKHPDEEVRKHIIKALERLGSDRLDEEVGEVPAIRTDLEEESLAPLTAEQKLKAKTEPLEKEATMALKNGPAEEAVKLYEQLLEFRPDYEPYEQALEKAKAYVKAADTASEHWYPDAPYIGLKGRYSYYLASEPEDTSTLKEEYDLARVLKGRRFEGWSNIFGKDPKGKDQFLKALKLYEHIVEYYPENEYLVIGSNIAIGGLNLNLYKDIESYVLAYIDVFATPVEEVVDSTDDRRNKPLEEAGGKTQAQLDFERLYKNFARDWVIERCTTAPEPMRQMLFNEIMEKCAQTDPKIVEMAKIARRKLHQNNTQKMD